MRATMAHTYTRKELYDLVSPGPLRTLCTQFGVSDVSVEKAYKKADIPTPPQGYWNKVQAGKKVSRITLSPRGLGQPDEVVIGAGRRGY
ncbi:hypothetical protein DK26_06885 [Bosea sp. WAO]|nr:hypothetical protein DK26_06885 [Bosea sp. WAO]